MSGFFAAGLVYAVLSGVVAVKGKQFIEKYLPPVVVGPVIMVIGLSLAPVAAVGMNTLVRSGDN